MKERNRQADGLAARIDCKGVKMFPAIRCHVAIACCCLFSVAPTSAQEASIEFDVPALIGVREILPSPFATSKVVEVLLPISTVIDSKHRGDVEEFRFDVSWNRSVYPLFDYSPKTQTVSDIEGLLNVEKNESRNASLNANVTGKPLDSIAASLSSDIGRGSSVRKSFQEIPQHDVIVASGTIDRGTGAFFRFHGSKKETIEGGRDLLLAYRVPNSWQNGILKVECRATGKRRVAGLWDEPFEIGRSFIVPLYLDGDHASQQLAIEFVRAEQGLQKSWLAFEKQLSNAKKQFPYGLLQGESALPDSWPHLLIQSGDDQYLSQYQGYLTQDVAVSAGKFVQARKGLLRNY
jgi:hypothetical protein